MSIHIKDIEEKLGYQLSKEQKEIIKHSGQPLSIVACAGSGKTTTIETKMIYDILNDHVKPSDVLCVTFSRRSQQDMNDKYDELYQVISGKRPRKRPSFSTFHSLFKRLIDDFIQIDYSDILTSRSKYHYQIMKALNFKVSSGVDLRIVLNEIFSYYGYNINTMQSVDGITNVTTVPNDALFTLEEYTTVIKTYKRLKQSDRVIDFEDMQTILYHTLNSDNKLKQQIALSIIEFVNSEYAHIYIDEFQDISTIQNVIMDQLIDGHYEKLIVVGDDDQSIYKFRGSNPKFILDFTSEINQAKTLHLSTNYRCKENILNHAKSMIESNELRFDKSIEAFNSNGHIEIFNDNDLSEKTLELVKHDMNHKPNESIAVLCRHNLQLSLIADLFTHHDIPVMLNRHENTVLQNHYLYHDLIETIKAFKYNDKQAFSIISHKIFMMISKKSVHDIINISNEDQSHWFDTLLMGQYRCKCNLLSIKQYKDSIESSNSAAYLIKLAYDLLKPYYAYLEEEKHSNQLNQLTIIHDHIQRILTNEPCTYDEFISKEDDKKSDLVINAEIEEGLSLITFHSAKGLEFDNVYIVNANHNSTPGTSRLATLAANITKLNYAFEYLEEERRLFYVACTRAKNKLIVSHLPNKQSIFVDELKDGQKRTLIDALQHFSFLPQVAMSLAAMIQKDEDKFEQQFSPYLTDKIKNQIYEYSLKSKDDGSYYDNFETFMLKDCDIFNQ